MQPSSLEISPSTDLHTEEMISLSRCSDLSFKLTSSCFETLEGFRAQLEKAVDTSLANSPSSSSDYNIRGILLCQV